MIPPEHPEHYFFTLSPSLMRTLRNFMLSSAGIGLRALILIMLEAVLTNFLNNRAEATSSVLVMIGFDLLVLVGWAAMIVTCLYYHQKIERLQVSQPRSVRRSW